MNNKALALDVLANIPKYSVNRVEKMDRTIDVMCDNHEKKMNQRLNGTTRSIEAAEIRGYGQDKYTGD